MLAAGAKENPRSIKVAPVIKDDAKTILRGYRNVLTQVLVAGKLYEEMSASSTDDAA